MTAKNRQRRPPMPALRQRLSSLAPELAPAKASFHASLRGCAKDRVKQPSPRRDISSLFRVWARQGQQRTLSALARVWSWLHAKYTVTQTKRLRVSETVSLGDKRFVALVNVGAREFLIGGGTQSVSLLAQWGTTPEPAEVLQPELGVEGNSE